MLQRLIDKFSTPEARWRRHLIAETIKGLKDRARPQVRECPICANRSLFYATGWPVRPEATCPSCHSLERHRLLSLWLSANPSEIQGKSVLHFAAEGFAGAMFRPLAAEYVTADLEQGRDLVLDIEKLDLPDGRFDVVVNSHVLEHVDAVKALEEIHRVLKAGGLAITMLPLIEGWSRTYENPAVITPEDREAHFGQSDHVRYFGADFREMAANAGFVVDEFTAIEPDVGKYGLLRGEKVFLLRKPG